MRRQYQRNLKAFNERLDALDARLKARLAGDCRQTVLCVSTKAYDYFESAYGLKHTGVFSVASEVQPGAQHVAAMRKRLQEVGKTCVFSEPPLRPRLARHPDRRDAGQTGGAGCVGRLHPGDGSGL
jgi:zinc transport system substrate-binding protein